MSESNRIHGFDTLRAVMLLLLFVIHAALSYMHTDVGDEWVYHDSSSEVFFDGLVIIIHFFRVPIFLIIAGFFAQMMLERYTERQFFLKRVKRLFLPFVLTMLLLMPVVNYLINSINHPADTFSWSQLLLNPSLYPMGVSTTYIWFIYYLILYNAIHLVLKSWIGPKINSLSILKPWLVIVLLFLTQTGLLLWSGTNYMVADYSLMPKIQPLMLHGIYYVLGVYLYRNRHLGSELEKRSTIIILFACLFLVFYLIRSYADIQSGRTQAPFDPILSLAGSLATFMFSIGGVGVGLKFSKKNTLFSEYFSKSSYFLYLIHFPFILLSLKVLQPYDWNAFIKFILVFTISLGASILSNEFWVRIWRRNPPI